QRMPLLDQPVVASFRRDLSAEQLPGLADGQVADIDDLLDLAAGLAQDLAILQADEPGQLFFARTKTVTEPAHDLAAVRCRHLPPTRECFVRLGDRTPAVVWARGSDLREQVPDRRRLLEAVAGKTASTPKALEAIDRTQDRLMVRRHLVQARPRRLDSGRGEPWRPTVDHLGHGVEDSPVDVRVEARLFIAHSHSEQQAVAFRMEIE